jgi:hypothetical protein
LVIALGGRAGDDASVLRILLGSLGFLASLAALAGGFVLSDRIAHSADASTAAFVAIIAGAAALIGWLLWLARRLDRRA